MQQKLTGIERELVLKYLRDANVPVTVTPLETAPESGVHSPTSAVFPVALTAEKLTVLNQGIILLANPPQAAAAFEGKTVRVEFYFNGLGLCFVTKMAQVSAGLALVIPAEISRISETPVQKTNSFTAELSYKTDDKTDVNLLCPAASGYRLFSKPVWSEIPAEESLCAKQYLEEFVAQAKKKKNLGNGIFLIPVCRYLASKKQNIHTLQVRSENPEVLYVNHEIIVFGNSSNKILFESGLEFNLKLAFPLDIKPMAVRDVYTECIVQEVYKDKDNSKECAVCRLDSMKEEDVRFVYEMTTKNLFI